VEACFGGKSFVVPHSVSSGSFVVFFLSPANPCWLMDRVVSERVGWYRFTTVLPGKGRGEGGKLIGKLSGWIVG